MNQDRIQPISDLVEGAAALGEAIRTRSPVVYLGWPAEGVGVAHAIAAFDGLDAPALAVDVAAAVAQGEEGIVDATILDARLRGTGLVVPPVEAVAAVPGAVDPLCRSARPIVLVGSEPWDPAWSAAVPLCLNLPSPSLDAQRALWADALVAAGAELEDERFEGLAGFNLSPAQVVRTAEQSAQRARHAGRHVTEGDLTRGRPAPERIGDLDVGPPHRAVRALG